MQVVRFALGMQCSCGPDCDVGKSGDAGQSARVADSRLALRGVYDHGARSRSTRLLAHAADGRINSLLAH